MIWEGVAIVGSYDWHAIGKHLFGVLVLLLGAVLLLLLSQPHHWCYSAQRGLFGGNPVGGYSVLCDWMCVDLMHVLCYRAVANVSE